MLRPARAVAAPASSVPAEVARAPAAPPIRWTSIDRQLPLLILGLLIPSILIPGVTVQAEVRRDLLDAAAVRLEGSAREVGALFQVGVGNRSRMMQRVAENPEVVAWTREPDPAKADAVRAALLPHLRRNTPSMLELWSLTGRRLLQVTSPRREAEESPPALHTTDWPAPRGVGYQPLRMLGGLPYAELALHVRPAAEDPAGAGPAVGYLVLRQAFSGAQAAELLGRLIGIDSDLRLGNADGSLWTDLEREVPPPGVAVSLPGRAAFTDAAGAPRLGAGVAIGDTPWLLWVESEAGSALAPADRLLVVMLVVGGALLLFGGIGARWISRRITAPLRAATEAAEAIAAGHYDRRLALERSDEVGRLTLAFNAMASKVEGARAEQEYLVARRTGDLTRALEQLRDAQDDLVRKEKLALLGQLAGSVGHELRNPLGVMTNAIFYLEMLLEDASPEVREYLGILRRQVNLAEKITSDLLDFTRHRPPNTARLDLGRLVGEQLARLGPLRVQVTNEIPDGLPAVAADPVQIGQVVFNLLTNAVQAMEAQPAGVLSLRAAARDGRVSLEVGDNGPGVRPELRDRIFEPLFTTRARGIGLGLSVSRRLAEGNRGSLTLAPAKAGGATFVLELPAADDGCER